MFTYPPHAAGACTQQTKSLSDSFALDTRIARALLRAMNPIMRNSGSLQASGSQRGLTYAPLPALLSRVHKWVHCRVHCTQKRTGVAAARPPVSKQARWPHARRCQSRRGGRPPVGCQCGRGAKRSPQASPVPDVDSGNTRPERAPQAAPRPSKRRAYRILAHPQLAAWLPPAPRRAVCRATGLYCRRVAGSRVKCGEVVPPHRARYTLASCFD